MGEMNRLKRECRRVEMKIGSIMIDIFKPDLSTTEFRVVPFIVTPIINLNIYS